MGVVHSMDEGQVSRVSSALRDSAKSIQGINDKFDVAEDHWKGAQVFNEALSQRVDHTLGSVQRLDETINSRVGDALDTVQTATVELAQVMETVVLSLREFDMRREVNQLPKAVIPIMVPMVVLMIELAVANAYLGILLTRFDVIAAEKQYTTYLMVFAASVLLGLSLSLVWLMAYRGTLSYKTRKAARRDGSDKDTALLPRGLMKAGSGGRSVPGDLAPIMEAGDEVDKDRRPEAGDDVGKDRRGDGDSVNDFSSSSLQSAPSRCSPPSQGSPASQSAQLVIDLDYMDAADKQELRLRRNIRMASLPPRRPLSERRIPRNSRQQSGADDCPLSPGPTSSSSLTSAARQRLRPSAASEGAGFRSSAAGEQAAMNAAAASLQQGFNDRSLTGASASAASSGEPRRSAGRASPEVTWGGPFSAKVTWRPRQRTAEVPAPSASSEEQPPPPLPAASEAPAGAAPGGLKNVSDSQLPALTHDDAGALSID